MLPHLKEQNCLSVIKNELQAYLENFAQSKQIVLEQPRNAQHGHLAWPLFALAKQEKIAPQKLAQELSKKISVSLPTFVKFCEPVAGFINFSFQETYLQGHLENLAKQKQLAQFHAKQAEHWLIDFASPNVAKYMNVGHLRATILGQVLVNLARAFGIKVTALNHLGDWGSQFGKLLWAYKQWGKEYDFKTAAFESLVELYVRFYKQAEGDPKKTKEARELFKKLEQGDKELKKLWQFFVDLSLKSYNQYWELFKVKHDLVLGESYYVSFVEKLKSRLKEQALLEKSEGAEVVFLNDSKVPCLITKSDGASTYASRDLCSLIYRFEELKVDKNIYITGSDQKLHFKQVFEVAHQINPEWNNLHLSFGMYLFKGEGKMSTRQGKAIYLKDILKQAIDKVSQIIEQRNPSLQNKEDIAVQVAVGALVFNDLTQDCIKDVDFDWNKILDFDGSSGPFVQYSLVRSNSLLKKAKHNQVDFKLSQNFASVLEHKEEKQLAWRLIQFESVCFQSLKKLKPHLLTRYLLDLSKEFNRFYNSQKIIGHPRESDLLLLTDITRRTLSRALELLNVPRPPAM